MYVWSASDRDAPAPPTVTPVHATEKSTSVCPPGHVKPPGLGGDETTVNVPVVCPFLTGKVPLPLTGAVTVTLLAAIGWLLPPFTHS